eukprot:720409-Rhodomonas_salina.1
MKATDIRTCLCPKLKTEIEPQTLNPRSDCSPVRLLRYSLQGGFPSLLSLDMRHILGEKEKESEENEDHWNCAMLNCFREKEECDNAGSVDVCTRKLQTHVTRLPSEQASRSLESFVTW